MNMNAINVWVLTLKLKTCYGTVISPEKLWICYQTKQFFNIEKSCLQCTVLNLEFCFSVFSIIYEKSFSAAEHEHKRTEILI